MRISASASAVTGACLAIVASSNEGRAADTYFSPPGQLESGSGKGVEDGTVYYPDIRFPLESGPAYANSQVYRPGGDHGHGGGQCSKINYSYPWRDNFCESRGWKMPLCPTGHGHQGQDIRPSTCKIDTHWAVAVSDGIIANVGSYSVTLQTADGTLFRYLHLNIGDLAIQELDHVKKGDRIGKVSNWFGGSKTTTHLHFDIKDTVEVGGRRQSAYVPPYTSLVASYKRMMNM